MKYLKWLMCVLVISVFLSSLISAGEGDWDETCMRAIPQPLFDSKMKMVKTEKFRQATKEEDAEEEVVFSSGDRLIIRNWGCEYFVNTFRYESKSMLVSSESLKDIFVNVAQVIRKLDGYKPNVIFDLGAAAKTLEKLLSEEKEISLEYWYPVEGDGLDFLQTRVVVKGGGPLEKEKGSYVEFELLKGPL